MSSCFTSVSDGMLVNLLVLSPRGARLTLFFVVIRVVNSFHKDLAVVDLVGHRTAEQCANSRTFEVVSATHGFSSSLLLIILVAQRHWLTFTGAKVQYFLHLCKKMAQKIAIRAQ